MICKQCLIKTARRKHKTFCTQRCLNKYFAHRLQYRGKADNLNHIQVINNSSVEVELETSLDSTSWSRLAKIAGKRQFETGNYPARYVRIKRLANISLTSHTEPGSVIIAVKDK